MNRITSFLALGAIVVAGAFAGTAAQASASNVSVSFTVHNADGSASAIRTGSSSSISGLTNPAAAILAGNYDPASGSGTFSAPAPALRQYVDGFVAYANASDGVSNKCTFNMRITQVGAGSFTLHAWITESGTNCSVPSDMTNSSGVFTGITLVWKT
ncbi:MAG TPA: hypothetical protein VGU66_09425 [Candidatus Elarobacter sp.]|nr:hypothetical protein [Candidatus Elarobacter sp.]